MPPLPASVVLKAVPTFADKGPVEIVGAAGTVSVVGAVLVASATDVAVTVAVTAELDAAGAV
jgi:hypothetical protein